MSECLVTTCGKCAHYWGAISQRCGSNVRALQSFGMPYAQAVTLMRKAPSEPACEHARISARYAPQELFQQAYAGHGFAAIAEWQDAHSPAPKALPSKPAKPVATTPVPAPQPPVDSTGQTSLF